MNKRVFARAFILALSYAIITLLLINLTDKLILTADFYNRSNKYFGDNPEQGAYIYKHLREWVYPLSLIYVFLKFLLISAVLYTGFYLSGIRKVFVSILYPVILADFIFFIPAIFKIYSFLYTNPQGDLTDWIHYFPASLLSIVNYNGAIWLYPLQTLNVFEIIYWFLLAFLLSRSLKISFDQSLRNVVISYLPALVIWGIIVVWYSVIINPSG